MRTRTRADGDEGGEEISSPFGSAVCAFISFPRRKGGGCLHPPRLSTPDALLRRLPRCPVPGQFWHAKILTVPLTGQNGRQTPRLARWRGDITWTALHRVGEVRLAERRSLHPLHADWSKAAAWLLPELRLLPKDRPYNNKLSNMVLHGLRAPNSQRKCIVLGLHPRTC